MPQAGRDPEGRCGPSIRCRRDLEGGRQAAVGQYLYTSYEAIRRGWLLADVRLGTANGPEAPSNVPIREQPKGTRKGAQQGPCDDRDPRDAVSRSPRQRRGTHPSGRQAALRVLERKDVGRWRPIDPSPTIDQAVNGGYSWLEIECSRCKTKRDVDLAALSHAPTTLVQDLASRLRCSKRAKAGRRPAATLLQLTARPRQAPPET